MKLINAMPTEHFHRLADFWLKDALIAFLTQVWSIVDLLGVMYTDCMVD